MEEKIERALRELLVTHNLVVLPGFGAFVATDIPAMVDSQNNTIYPPRRKVDYDPDHTEDDGLLISFYARQERITKDTAAEHISEFVAETRHKLERGTPWIVEDLGKFIIDGLNHLNFFPDPDQNFTPQSYGLPGIEIDPDREDVVVSTPAPEKEKEAEAPVKKRRKVKAGWVLLTGLLLIAGASYGFLFHTAKGREMKGKLHALYKEKTGGEKKEAKKDEEKKSEPQVAAVAVTKDSAAVTPAEIALPAPATPDKTSKKEESAGKASPEETTALYKPRTSQLSFEKPAHRDIVPTALDKYVKQETVPEEKTVAALPPKKESRERAKTPPAKTTAKPKTEKKAEPVRKVVKNVPSNTVAKKSEPAPSEPVKTSSAITRSPETIYARYQVVASEHPHIESAVEASEKYNKMGYNVAVIRFRDGTFGVCLARSNDRTVAEKQLASIRSQVSTNVRIKEY